MLKIIIAAAILTWAYLVYLLVRLHRLINKGYREIELRKEPWDDDPMMKLLRSKATFNGDNYAEAAPESESTEEAIQKEFGTIDITHYSPEQTRKAAEECFALVKKQREEQAKALGVEPEPDGSIDEDKLLDAADRAMDKQMKREMVSKIIDEMEADLAKDESSGFKS